MSTNTTTTCTHSACMCNNFTTAIARNVAGHMNEYLMCIYVCIYYYLFRGSGTEALLRETRMCISYIIICAKKLRKSQLQLQFTSEYIDHES